MHAFRCKNCGHLHAADAAGQHAHPHACAVCGAGVHFTKEPDKLIAELSQASSIDPKLYARFETGVPGTYKIVDPAPWEVLADATPERLTELGLTTEEVTRHEPFLTHHRQVGTKKTTFVHKGSPEHCAACQRTGTNHEEGVGVEVEVPVHQESRTRVRTGEAVPVGGQSFTRDVAEGQRTKDSGIASK